MKIDRAAREDSVQDSHHVHKITSRCMELTSIPLTSRYAQNRIHTVEEIMYHIKSNSGTQVMAEQILKQEWTAKYMQKED